MRVPYFHNSTAYEYPQCPNNGLKEIVDDYRSLFRTTPGATEIACHYIPMTGPLCEYPPRQIPAHYRQEVEKQIDTMLNQRIIEESSSPMAPPVFVPKKSGEILMCVDYQELN